MLVRRLFWPELIRVWAQWLGIGLAAIPSGLILGVLEKHGTDHKAALAVALAVGFILALAIWLLIARQTALKPVEYTVGVSYTVISLEPACAVAAVALLCVTLSGTLSSGMGDQLTGANSSSGHAIP